MSLIHGMAVFYFSGTGNSKRVAMWVAECCEKRQIPCSLADISSLSRLVTDDIDPERLIVIVSPIHGFNYPPVMLHFIKTFPEGHNRIALLNTRGAVKIGRFVTPGLTGVAFMLSSVILRRKGYRVIAQIPFDMPSNMISIHPAIRRNAAQYIFDKSYKKVSKHFERICAGHSDFASRKEIIQDVLIIPVSIAYYLCGRFFLAKSYYASCRCTKCDLCIEECPVQAIKKVNDRPYWTLKCESCMKCMNNCPVKAIDTPHGLWALIFYLTSLTCASITLVFFQDTGLSDIADFFVFNLMLVFMAVCLYRLQQLALTCNMLSRILALASFTHYTFWGRYRSNWKLGVNKKGRSALNAHSRKKCQHPEA